MDQAVNTITAEELFGVGSTLVEQIDERVREARAMFREALAKYKEEIAPEAEKVRAAGGLFIIGTERHESRRIDNQLRGRAGRQGDPGESRFFLSLEDDLMRLFGSERIGEMCERLGLDENTLVMEYELSVFSYWGAYGSTKYNNGLRNSIHNTYLYIENNYDGDSFSEKVEDFLLDIGVTADEIASIKDIMLEEVE